MIDRRNFLKLTHAAAATLWLRGVSPAHAYEDYCDDTLECICEFDDDTDELISIVFCYPPPNNPTPLPPPPPPPPDPDEAGPGNGGINWPIGTGGGDLVNDATGGAGSDGTLVFRANSGGVSSNTSDNFFSFSDPYSPSFGGVSDNSGGIAQNTGSATSASARQSNSSAAAATAASWGASINDFINNYTDPTSTAYLVSTGEHELGFIPSPEGGASGELFYANHYLIAEIGGDLSGGLKGSRVESVGVGGFIEPSDVLALFDLPVPKDPPGVFEPAAFLEASLEGINLSWAALSQNVDPSRQGSMEMVRAVAGNVGEMLANMHPTITIGIFVPGTIAGVSGQGYFNFSLPLAAIEPGQQWTSTVAFVKTAHYEFPSWRDFENSVANALQELSDSLYDQSIQGWAPFDPMDVR